MTGERGGIVTGWLLKLVVSLAIVGVGAFEGGAVIVTRVNTDSAATDVSTEAIAAYGTARNVQAAERAARETAAAKGVTLVAFSASGDAVVITVEKRAKTLLLHRLSATRSWTVSRVTRRRTLT